MKEYVPFLLVFGAFVSCALFYFSSRKKPVRKKRKIAPKAPAKALQPTNKQSIEELLKNNKKPEPSILGMILRENIIRTTRRNPDQIAEALRVWLKEESSKNPARNQNSVDKKPPVSGKAKKR